MLSNVWGSCFHLPHHGATTFTDLPTLVNVHSEFSHPCSIRLNYIIYENLSKCRYFKTFVRCKQLATVRNALCFQFSDTSHVYSTGKETELG